MAEHNELGSKGEELAKLHLLKAGYQILASNWRYDKSEVDIICKKGNTVVFVEVKTRKSNAHGFPEQSVNGKKQLKLLEAAEVFIEKNNFTGEIRFDVISIVIGNPQPEIFHIKDAFFPYQE